MDVNNGRAAQGQVPIQGQVTGGDAVAAGSTEGGDWRTLLPESRQRIVDKIMETLSKHLPVRGQEGLQELKKIGVRFEEKIYISATSQSDYLRKISLKMLTMETKAQFPMWNSLQSNDASDSKSPQEPVAWEFKWDPSHFVVSISDKTEGVSSSIDGGREEEREMASYAALLSLLHTLNQIKNHPRPPISLDQQQCCSLTQNLTFLQDFLERYSSKDDELNSRITAAAYAAEDLIESHIVDQIHAGSTSCGEIVRSIDLHQGLERVIVDMDLIKKEVMEVMIKEKIKGSQHHHLHTHSSVSTASAGQSSVKVGFDDVLVNKVLDKLIGQQCCLEIIPIVGMGGIGKTTFAKYIYSNPLIVQHFDVLAWVTISQEYSRRNILQVLCQEIHGNNIDLSEKSEDNIGEIIYKRLWGRRYLIVMDDIWNVEALYQAKSFFPNSDDGRNRIMITTRQSNLTVELSGCQDIHMQFLDEDKSWDLLCKTVFGNLDCPIELEDIGKEIARNCRGLPLSVAVIGGLLTKSNMTQLYWEYSLHHLNSLINLNDNEYCLQVLRTSYKELPIHLKPCFLYLGVFLEDCEINVSKLIKLWVSEGILKPKDDKILEDVAEDYLNELIERNLVLVAEFRWNGKAKICKIHDLLRDVCLREAKKQKFFCVVRKQKHHSLQGINVERRICIEHEQTNETYSPEFLYALESSLARSLVCCKRAEWFKYRLPLHFKLLRVFAEVDAYRGIANHNNAIFKHANLRYMSLQLFFDTVSRFPSFCSLLWNLQTLVVEYMCPDMPAMAPSEFWEMPLLRHVMLKKFELPDPPVRERYFVLKNLHTLSCITNLRFSEEVVKRIPNVKKLKVRYEGTGVDWKEWTTYFCLHNLGRLQKLESLNLIVYPIHDNWSEEIILGNSVICFPHSLKKLSLSGTMLYWEEFSAKICSLAHLQLLRLNENACSGPKWETVEGQFCSLRVLQIVGPGCGLKYWDTDNTHFPRLEHLRLESLKELEEIPSCIGNITTLKSIELKDCTKFANFSAKRIEMEQVEEYGNEVLQVIINEAEVYWDEEDQVDSDEEDQVDWDQFDSDEEDQVDSDDEDKVDMDDDQAFSHP